MFDTQFNMLMGDFESIPTINLIGERLKPQYHSYFTGDI